MIPWDMLFGHKLPHPIPPLTRTVTLAHDDDDDINAKRVAHTPARVARMDRIHAYVLAVGTASARDAAAGLGYARVTAWEDMREMEASGRLVKTVQGRYKARSES